MTSKDIENMKGKDELVEDLEATDEEAENVKGGVFRPVTKNRPTVAGRPTSKPASGV